ncbi:NifU-like protein [Candidatus Zixiibacteriota bacterium]|nr:NifU-like protein [candidate division Zixibacteria bacterium]
MSDHLDDLYRDILMEHYRFPRGRHHLEHEDIHNEGQNPTCGDEIELALELEGDKVKDVYVSCMGCAVSVASGSMLAEVTKGKSLEEVKKIAETIKAMLTGGAVPKDADLGDLEALSGVKKFPVRVKCALLSWTTLVNALEAREKGKQAAPSTTE